MSFEKTQTIRERLQAQLGAYDILAQLSAEHPEIVREFCRNYLAEEMEITVTSGPNNPPKKKPSKAKSENVKVLSRKVEILNYVRLNGPCKMRAITEALVRDNSKEERRRVESVAYSLLRDGELKKVGDNGYGTTLYDAAQ